MPIEGGIVIHETGILSVCQSESISQAVSNQTFKQELTCCQPLSSDGALDALRSHSQVGSLPQLPPLV